MEKKQANKKGALIGCGMMVVALIILAVSLGTCLGGDTEELTLSAEVRYNNGQFTITNNDDFDWRKVTFYLNSDYKLYAPVIEANSTYTVGATQFTKSDGTVFNPYSQKPEFMSIAAETWEGQSGWWHGGWE